jgi:hypothetical protein
MRRYRWSNDESRFEWRRGMIGEFQLTRRLMLLATAGAAQAPISGSISLSAAVLHSQQRGMCVGLFRDFGQLVLPSDVQLVLTSGYHAVGVGMAHYALTNNRGKTAYRTPIADGRWFELVPDSAGVSPQQLGARADYDRLRKVGADDSDAFLEWVDYCTSRGEMRAWRGRLEGDYLITQNNVLGRWTAQSGPVIDWQIAGMGAGNCSITFQPRATATPTSFLLYDGLASSGTASIPNALLGLRISGCELHLDSSHIGDTDRIAWFRQSGWSADRDPQQGWVFDQVAFRGDRRRPSQVGAILEIVGNANGSENAFHLCRGYWWGHVIDCRNAQAVNHLSNFCHWELGFGDAFRFVRGGALTIVGGSIILDNHDAPAWEKEKTYVLGASCWHDGRHYRALSGGASGSVAPTHVEGAQTDGAILWAFVADESFYLLCVGGDLTGQINSFALYGARVELRSCRAKLLKGGDLNTGTQVLFSGVSVQAVTGGYRTSIAISESALKIKFDSCYLSAPGHFSEPIVITFGGLGKADGNYMFRARSGPQVRLVNCWVSSAIHDLVSWEPNATGIFSIEDCYGASSSTDQGGTSPELLFDCDMYNPGRSFTAKGMPPRHLKSKLINFATYPGRHRQAAAEVASVCTFVMPPGAILKHVHFAKANKDGNSVPVILALEAADGDRTVRFASFPAANFAAGFSLDTGDIMKVIAEGQRVLRITEQSGHMTGAVHPHEPGDFLLVEYY